jgi:HTH-type transcriptional regulator/antitoxin HigA
MNVKPIHNESDYNAALARVDALWEAMPGTLESDELEVLAVLIDNYEGNLGKMSAPEPNPIKAITCFMEQRGL